MYQYFIICIVIQKLQPNLSYNLLIVCTYTKSDYLGDNEKWPYGKILFSQCQYRFKKTYGPFIYIYIYIYLYIYIYIYIYNITYLYDRTGVKLILGNIEHLLSGSRGR